MKVFISWSGEESRAVATVLRDELPCVINAIKPFVSSEDIDKGTLWFQKIATELENSDFGIICLTETNKDNKWVLFEAGALAGRFSRTRVAPLLANINESSITQPLSQFQLTSLGNKEDFFKLLKSINAAAKEHSLEENVLRRSFENWWEPFSKKIVNVLAAIPKKSNNTPKERTEKEMIEEILSLVRSVSANNQKTQTLVPTVSSVGQIGAESKPSGTIAFEDGKFVIKSNMPRVIFKDGKLQIEE